MMENWLKLPNLKDFLESTPEVLTLEIVTDLSRVYCKDDSLNLGEFSIDQFLVYLIYVKHIKRNTMFEIIKDISKKIRDENNSERFSSMIKEVCGVKHLVKKLPFEQLGIKDNLFPCLTESDIDDVYERSQPDLPTLQRITAHVKKIERIVNEWNEDAKVAVFGSCTNGFLIKDCSDVDITILLRSKLYSHPSKYNKQLKESLKLLTNENWEEIKTKRLYLLSSKYKDSSKIEILFNNISGLVNSEYIRKFAEYDYRFHKLGYFIKNFISESKIFSDMVKLNSFTIICMLIVYLQDIVQPPVLPRIITTYYNKKPLLTPTYIFNMKTNGENIFEDNNAIVDVIRPDLNMFEEQMKLERKRLKEHPELINHSSCVELFVGFIHFYFNGGGFDHIQDIVNTRSG